MVLTFPAHQGIHMSSSSPRNAVPQLDSADSSLLYTFAHRSPPGHLCETLLSPTLVCFFTLLLSMCITLRF